LSPSHVPDNLLHREREESLALDNAKNGVNTFVYGPSGSGKTVVLKKVCLESSSSGGRIFYIDCSLYQTINSVLREILTDRLVFSRSNYDLFEEASRKEQTEQGDSVS